MVFFLSFTYIKALRIPQNHPQKRHPASHLLLRPGRAIDAGNQPLTYDGWTYTWEAGRRLKKQEKGTTSIEYTYDESGLRTQKKVTENGKTTVYDYVWKGDRLIGLTIYAGISTEYL